MVSVNVIECLRTDRYPHSCVNVFIVHVASTKTTLNVSGRAGDPVTSLRSSRAKHVYARASAVDAHLGPTDTPDRGASVTVA